jgi:hypothetical protein
MLRDLEDRRPTPNEPPRVVKYANEPEPFDAEDFVWKYRYAKDKNDVVMCPMLRKVWHEWHGEDSLHSMAYGVPITSAMRDERGRVLLERLHAATLHDMARIESEMAWLSTLEAV